MPLYQHIILAVPKALPKDLSTFFKKYSSLIMDCKGLVRGIENHGVRPLPARTRRYLLMAMT
jgi:hypothetical protein